MITDTAIGTFTGLPSISDLLASSLTGMIWFQFGAITAVLLTATINLLAVITFMVRILPPTVSNE